MGGFQQSALQALAAGKEYLERKRRLATTRAHDEEAIREKQALLEQFQGKLTGATATELERPLRFEARRTERKAVLLVTSDIEIHGIEITRSAVRLLPRDVGVSVDSLSHWALCVVDRGLGPCYCYDLMSDQLVLNMLGKSYARSYPVTTQLLAGWNSCSYMGETTRSHDEIMALASKHISHNPRYNLLSNNCQHLAEALVRELCNGKLITQANLGLEMKMAQERLALLLKTIDLEDLKKVPLQRRVTAGGKHGRKAMFGVKLPFSAKSNDDELR